MYEPDTRGCQAHTQYAPSILSFCLFEEIRVNLDKMLPFFRSCRFLKYGCDGTCGFASSAVDTLIRINIEHLSLFKSCLALCRMDTVNRTYIHTGCVLYTDTGLSNYVCHVKIILLLLRHVKNWIRGSKVFFSASLSIEPCVSIVNSLFPVL